MQTVDRGESTNHASWLGIVSAPMIGRCCFTLGLIGLLNVIPIGASAQDSADLTVKPKVSTGQWTMPRGDAQATGAIPTALPETLKERWTFQADEAIEVTPIVTDKVVFLADVFGKIYAVNRQDGKQIWVKNYDTGFSAAPIYHDQRLYLGDIEGNVYALQASDGKEIWKKSVGGEISGAPAIYKQNVLVPSQDGILYCFAAKDGADVWRYEANDQIRCSPTIAGDKTFLGGCDGQLHIVDLTSGKPAGEPLPLGGPTGSTPAVVGDQVYVPIMDGVVFGFDLKKRSKLWEYADEDVAQEYRNSPAVAKNKVVVSSQRKQVDCLDANTGKRVWRYTLKRRADASPVIAGDDVWIASSDGRLIRLALADGKEKWSYEVKGGFIAAPAIANNELFIADEKGVLRCFATPQS